jgi:hypothetical protein
MLAALIGLAIGWAIKATLLDGPISFWKAFGIGVLVMLPLLAAIPDSSFAPIVGGAIALALSTGYTGKSRKKSNTINKARTASSKRLHPQKPNLKQSTQPKKKEPVKTERRNTTITPLSESSPQTHQDTGVDYTDSKQVETKLSMYKEMEREGLISKEDYQKLKRKLLGL